MAYFKKKGDLAIRYIILIALAIIVLIIVAIIFHTGASDFADKIKNVLSEIWSIKPKIE